MSRNPFDDIERMFDRMSHQLDPFESDLSAATTPVDVEDAGEEYVVTADLPGFPRERIDVQLAGETLTISADHEESSADSESDYVRRERRKQSVSRSLRLPEPIEEGGTEATYTNGVLTVRLPKADAADGHDIPIN